MFEVIKARLNAEEGRDINDIVKDIWFGHLSKEWRTKSLAAIEYCRPQGGVLEIFRLRVPPTLFTEEVLEILRAHPQDFEKGSDDNTWILVSD